MICSLCSLLCDQPALQSSCSLRAHILSLPDVQASDSSLRSGAAPKPPSQADALARNVLRAAKSIHIAGRFHCVETSRAAIEFARAFRASIDGSNPSSMFDVAQAIASSGAYLCSLAEARSISDCLIIINSAGLLDRFPQLPAALNRRFLDTTTFDFTRTGVERIDSPKSSARIILLGPDSPVQTSCWQEHFEQVIAHPCELEAIPSKLLEIQRSNPPIANSLDSSSQLASYGWSEAISNSQYPVVIWGSGALPVKAIDLWAERLQSWFIQRNEHGRASGLILSSLANVFHHTSTWLTGFPSRLDFTQGELRWERHEASTDRWLEKYRQNEGACLVWIDESGLNETQALWSPQKGDRFRLWQLTVSKLALKTDTSQRVGSAVTAQGIRIGRPGVDYPATLLRSDQIVMSYPDADPALQRVDVVRAASWLRGLLD